MRFSRLGGRLLLAAAATTAAAAASLPERGEPAKPVRVASGDEQADVAPEQDSRELATEAVIAAGKAVAEARELAMLWVGTQALLTAAKKAGQKADFEETIRLANLAREEAELAINQAYLAKARYRIAVLETRPLGAEQQRQLDRARTAYRAHRGREAWRLSGGLE